MKIAKIDLEKPVVPDCSYPLPPYQFRGEGIVLIYEIPFSRVSDLIPSGFSPDPGKKKIWFMVNFYNWKKFNALDNPDDHHSFCEAYYKFSVSCKKKLGDFPVKLYLTSDAAIASGIELYGYPKYPAEMHFKTQGNDTIAGIRTNKRTELEVRLEKAAGITAKIASFFANAMAGSYIKKYTGNYLYSDSPSPGSIICGPTQIHTIQYKMVRIKKIVLREPLEWNILTEPEIQKPKYAFTLANVTATLSPPQKISLHEEVL